MIIFVSILKYALISLLWVVWYAYIMEGEDSNPPEEN